MTLLLAAEMEINFTGVLVTIPFMDENKMIRFLEMKAMTISMVAEVQMH